MILIEQYRNVVGLYNHVFNKSLRTKNFVIPLVVGPRYIFYYPHRSAIPENWRKAVVCRECLAQCLGRDFTPSFQCEVLQVGD